MSNFTQCEFQEQEQIVAVGNYINTFSQHAPYETAETSEIHKITSKIFKGFMTGGAVLACTFNFGITNPSLAQTQTFFLPNYEMAYSSTSIYEKAALETVKLFEYKFEQFEEILTYIVAYPKANEFLAGIVPILNRIYLKENTHKILELVQDPDTNNPLLELTFQSGMAIDENFIKKDQELFKKIEENGLVEGLRYVVLTNC